MLLKNPALERMAEGVRHLSYEEIIGHPRFTSARRVHLDRFLEAYDHNPFLVRLLVEAGRYFVYRLAIALDVNQDPDDRHTWFTSRRLRREIAGLGLRSERHVDQSLSR